MPIRIALALYIFATGAAAALVILWLEQPILR